MRQLFIFTTLLVFFSCDNKSKQTDDLEQHKVDTVYSQTSFSIDSGSTDFRQFYKQGAVKGQYIHRMDCCEGESKIYTLFDKNENDIFIFGIQDMCLVSTKKQFDNAGQLTKEYKLLGIGDSCFDNPDDFYKSDSLLLSTIIPLTENKWCAVQDSAVLRRQ